METKKVDRLFFGNTGKELFQKFDTTYLFTTENIAGYMPPLKDKTVLTVASSGDHFLNALYMVLYADRQNNAVLQTHHQRIFH